MEEDGEEGADVEDSPAEEDASSGSDTSRPLTKKDYKRKWHLKCSHKSR